MLIRDRSRESPFFLKSSLFHLYAAHYHFYNFLIMVKTVFSSELWSVFLTARADEEGPALAFKLGRTILIGFPIFLAYLKITNSHLIIIIVIQEKR